MILARVHSYKTRRYYNTRRTRKIPRDLCRGASAAQLYKAFTDAYNLCLQQARAFWVRTKASQRETDAIIVYKRIDRRSTTRMRSWKREYVSERRNEFTSATIQKLTAVRYRIHLGSSFTIRAINCSNSTGSELPLLRASDNMRCVCVCVCVYRCSRCPWIFLNCANPCATDYFSCLL